MQWRDSMRASCLAGLWQVEFAAGVVDVATGALVAIKLAQLVVELVKSHLNNFKQAQLLQTYVEIIMPEVWRLEKHLRTQAAPEAAELQPIIKAINLVGHAHEVRCRSCRCVGDWRAGSDCTLLLGDKLQSS
jgi:hypothetical protein